ncbi:probable 60S ribosomal protein L14 [Hevea brasiliensis]|uniref:probable 60S ribosomal protein L14 n=1 Tax=Hevea brasiliensis TaxID=3981 RepID=UPI0025E80955|nr:probable 60S ribosomal protein L14 [Hevea brasiliensis]
MAMASNKFKRFEREIVLLANRLEIDFPEDQWPIKRYVEIERLALANYSKDYRKLGVIIDVIDKNRATIGTPNMVRSQMNFKRRSSTSRLKLAVPLSEIDPQIILVNRLEIGTVMGKEDDWKKIKVAIMIRISPEKLGSEK